MQIILQEDVEKLGHRGEVVTVKPGYARNFLLPRKLAIEASSGNMKALEKIRNSLAKKTATELEAAQKQAGLLNGVSLSFKRKTGENDQMFGSVTSGDIVDGLEAQGFKIDKRHIVLKDAIRTLGDHTVTVKVFRDITAEIKVHVEKEG
ncbi:MAG TPA: 50S ribosomal protein L9 [Candidatus Saccharimonadales bacterium]|nr:50S ribosomal protein L9 [Candidatus Saccharimonadales bacterium]